MFEIRDVRGTVSVHSTKRKALARARRLARRPLAVVDARPPRRATGGAVVHRRNPVIRVYR